MKNWSLGVENMICHVECSYSTKISSSSFFPIQGVIAQQIISHHLTISKLRTSSIRFELDVSRRLHSMQGFCHHHVSTWKSSQPKMSLPRILGINQLKSVDIMLGLLGKSMFILVLLRGFSISWCKLQQLACSSARISSLTKKVARMKFVQISMKNPWLEFAPPKILGSCDFLKVSIIF